MIIQGFDIKIFEEAPGSAAYYTDGYFEIYYDGFTLKKVCTKKEAKKISEQLNIEWQWGD